MYQIGATVLLFQGGCRRRAVPVPARRPPELCDVETKSRWRHGKHGDGDLMARQPSLRRSVPGIWRILRYFWPWVRTERRLIATSMSALLVGVLLRLAEPWPLKFVLDRVIPTQRPDGMNSLPLVDDLSPMMLLTLMAGAVVAVSSLRAVVDYYNRIGFARLAIRVLRQVRNDVYFHVQGLSLAFHSKARTGDLIVRLTRDVSLLRDVTSTALLPMVGSVMILVGMITVMLFLQVELGLLALVTLPAFWLATSRIGRGIHLAARKQRAREGAMAATAAESIGAIREIQALSLEDRFAEDFSSRNQMSQQEDLKASRLSAKLGRTVDALLAVATALVLWYGARLVIGGRLTPGDLIVFLTYLKRAFKPVKDFAKYTARLAKATAAGERVLALLEQERDVRDLPGAVPAARFEGTVRFEDVSFEFTEGQTVLAGVDFEVRPGQLVVLTGPSGGGKSTLVGLLMRLYDPGAGRIVVDGRDIREYTLRSLRPQISVVLQDAVLFATTVSENIAFGTPDATPARIEAAARLANAHPFITDLPQGYETLVGERGATLSRGQRQRISIARAAIRETPLLILDEPTTALDEENERKVAAALRRLAEGRTTFLVTHDLRLAAGADRVLYLDGGRVLEWGSPAALIEAGGRFAELYKLRTNRTEVHGT